jgi:hypothetical protein
MALIVTEVDAAELASELFAATFKHSIPDFPRHFVALYRDSNSALKVAGYIHYTAWEESVWLCGGLCIDPDAYSWTSEAEAAEWKHVGGLGEILLRATFARLMDRPAIFGHCGNDKQLRHDLNVGFVPAGPPFLLVKWNRAMSLPDQARLVARVAALGHF